MQIRPLHDRVLVKRLEPEHTTVSGIVIPDKAAEKPDQGKVIATGAGVMLRNGTLRSLGVKIGDQVLFAKYAGQAVKVSGDEFLVLREADIIAVVES